MASKVFKIANTLHMRLKCCSENNQVGYQQNGLVFGFNSISKNNESFCIGAVSNEEDIPFANVLLGVYFFGDSLEDSNILTYCGQVTKSKKSGKIAILCFGTETKTLFYDIKSKKFCECASEIIDYQNVLSEIVQISLNTQFNLRFTHFKENSIENIEKSFDQIKSAIGDSSFCLDGSSYYLSNEDDDNLTVEDLYNEIEDFDELNDVQIPLNMKKKMIEKLQRKLKSDKKMLKFKYSFECNETDTMANNTTVELEEGKDINLNFSIKVILNVQLQHNTSYLQKTFMSCLSKLLSHHQKLIPSSLDSSCICIPDVCNFYDPSVYSHTVCVVYHNISNEEQFQNQRKNIHLKYLIPIEKPMFKLVNRFDSKVDYENRIVNVHLGLSSGIKNGQCCTVAGKYLYFHYNQDQTNDSGWGCAYRSLQTIISWFKLQGYIEIEKVPNHKEIQQALVDVGDKPASFVGTSKWIGSQEVCYVLTHLYSIESKIIFINSGAELANKARELIQHFTKNGTPIMIGGGVLAHTIIGVDFDENTGNIKFLVLDPHYVGDDDIGNIHKKGWCGWKPVSFWDKNSFYNLCLPQRPKQF